MTSKPLITVEFLPGNGKIDGFTFLLNELENQGTKAQVREFSGCPAESMRNAPALLEASKVVLASGGRLEAAAAMEVLSKLIAKIESDDLRLKSGLPVAVPSPRDQTKRPKPI